MEFSNNPELPVNTKSLYILLVFESIDQGHMTP